MTCRSVVVIAAREVYGHSRNGVIWLLVLFSVLVSVLATRVGVEQVRERRAGHDSFVAALEQDRARAGNRTSGTQLDPGLRAIRPAEPASAIVRGREVSLPQFWDFGPAGPQAGQAVGADNEGMGTLDFEFIVRVLLGLLAVILAIEGIAGERANGALLALLGQPVKSPVVLTGKLIGGGATIAIAVAMIATATIIVLRGSGEAALTVSLIGSTLALAGAAWLYLFAVFMLGAFVSVLARTYAGALITTVLVWAISCAVGGALPFVIARTVSPVRSAAGLEQQAERVHQERARRAQMEMGERYVAGLPAGADWTRPDRDAETRAAAVARVQPVLESYFGALSVELRRLTEVRSASLARQRQLTSALGVLSLGSQFAAAAANLAGTGDANAARWEATVRAHQTQLDRVLFHDPARVTLLVPATSAAGPGPNGRWIVALTRRRLPEFSELPRLVTPSASLGRRIADAMPQLLGMAVITVGLTVVTLLAFKRMKF